MVLIATDISDAREVLPIDREKEDLENSRLKTSQSCVLRMKGGCAEGAYLKQLWNNCAIIVCS
jgi:hypothetical protein